MEAFWRRGYVATSMADIYQATGLKPGNLYTNFKDKDALFRRAFETYTSQFRATLPGTLSGQPAIEKWLSVQVRLATDDPERKGCLIINTIMEREAHSSETKALADERLDEIRAFFERHLRIAVERGEIHGDTDAAAVADFLTGAVFAIMSLARGGAEARMIWNVAEQALAALRKPS